ncbi:Uncharacterized protein Adt_23489 [Abeliophyllum distichum]|uniref:Uncharacterized protein n=1 Tax=Abeliophyllum distichum TaxID=126358 RepID=A0ABD1SCP8_9LAMI
MRREYLLLHEILRSTRIEYDHQNNTIVADDWWWERKIQANKDFVKFHGRDCGEIYHKYSQLLGDAYNSEKYDVSPTKLSKKGFDDDEFWESVGNSDKLPVNVEMRDEHAPSEYQGSGVSDGYFRIAQQGKEQMFQWQHKRKNKSLSYALYYLNP